MTGALVHDCDNNEPLKSFICLKFFACIKYAKNLNTFRNSHETYFNHSPLCPAVNAAHPPISWGLSHLIVPRTFTL